MNEDMNENALPSPTEEDAGTVQDEELFSGASELSGLKKENERLQSEVDALKAQISNDREKAEAEEYLASLAGGRDDRLFAEALRQSAEREEWKTLPYKQRYELAYYLCLGREKHASRGSEPSAPPAFARSGGHGESPSTPMKTPTNFEMAHENAMKYFARG